MAAREQDLSSPLMLNSQNYYSPESDRAYMSNSQFKSFLECEARTMAEIRGQWKEEPTEAMLVGSYLHAIVEGTQDQFREDNPSMFKKDGKPYAKFEQAELMAKVILEDEFASFVLKGEHEHIVAAQFGGVWWKAKLDVYNPKDGRIVDVKTVAKIRDKHWTADFGWASFVEAYGYVRQLAIYLELERIRAGRVSHFEPLIVAVSKEDPPDKEIIGLDADRIAFEIEQVKLQLPHIINVKHGLEEPKRCEKCKYCRASKRLSHIVHYMDLLS